MIGNTDAEGILVADVVLGRDFSSTGLESYYAQNTSQGLEAVHKDGSNLSPNCLKFSDEQK